MKTTQQLRTEMFERIEFFGTEYQDQLQLSAPVRALFAENSNTIEAIRTAAREQHTGNNTRTSGTDQRLLIAKSLLPLLQNIAEIARTLDPEAFPGVAAKFPAPEPRNYPALIMQANSLLAEAVAKKEVFINGGLPDDFDVILADLLDRFKAATAQQQTAVQTRSNQTGTIEKLVRHGMSTTRKIRAALRYKLAADPALAKTFARAARVEKTPTASTPSQENQSIPASTVPAATAQG